MPRHDVHSSSCPPITGARIGATPTTSISTEKNRAIAAPENRSRTAARAITIPVAAPSACTALAAIRTSAEGLTAANTEATMKIDTPTSRGPRRPHESESGPATSWPTPRPTRNTARVSCNTASVEPRSSAMSGRAGRYMSIDSGPNAVSPPRMSAKRAVRPLPGATVSVSVASVSATSVVTLTLPPRRVGSSAQSPAFPHNLLVLLSISSGRCDLDLRPVAVRGQSSATGITSVV